VCVCAGVCARAWLLPLANVTVFIDTEHGMTKTAAMYSRDLCIYLYIYACIVP
jgi:hypothetical protein